MHPLRPSLHLFVLLALAAPALGHPVPDLPVRTHFSADGKAEIRVEVDPRAFADDPESIEYHRRGSLEALPEAERQAMREQADAFVRQRLRFFLQPAGELQPEFVWTFEKLGDGEVPFETDEEDLLKGDEVVLVGSATIALPESATGYQVEALPVTSETMGKPLNVPFYNYLGGVQVERYAVLFPGETSFVLELAGLGAEGEAEGVRADGGDWFSLFLSEVRRGFRHVIPEGLDHILFVLGVFLMTRKWKPLLLQISAFTIAHTLTLWLASARIVQLPGNLVEAVIAASIVAVALENILHRRYTHWRLLLVFAFGLIHGLGFAGAMATSVDSTAALVVGLLGINLGVELGQLGVISVALLATFWIEEGERYRRFVVVPGSVLVGLAGLWWFVERVSG